MKLCGFEAGLDRPFFLIAGPCVVESRELAMNTAGELKTICSELGIPFIFKASYDKANRSSSKSFRGLGMDKGLEILADVRKTLGVPVLTDVHAIEEIAQVAATVDVLQTPAFLCRQTDFITAVASAGKPVNIKKGQFLAPGDMVNVVDKARAASGHDNIMVCKRGASFGGIRCNTLGAVARGAGHQQRRAAGVRAGSGARCRRQRHLRTVHGNPSATGKGAVGRTECLAPETHEIAAENTRGTGCPGQTRRVCGRPSLIDLI
jgi:hypothetical protein